MLLFVGTPNLAARELRIGNRLQSVRLSAEERERIRALVKAFLASRWESLRFLTFAESESFAAAVADLSVSINIPYYCSKPLL